MTRKKRYRPCVNNPSDIVERAVPEPNSGCWLWTGPWHSHGYGLLTLNAKQRLAHRLAYEFHRGPIPEGLYVLHRCDTPACVNPDHLFLGTHLDNMMDATAKKRHPRGMAHFYNKLTDEQVREIRRRHVDGESHSKMAPDYGVNRRSIDKICRGERWLHVQ